MRIEGVEEGVKRWVLFPHCGDGFGMDHYSKNKICKNAPKLYISTR
jgi:hypothetical protein